MSSNQNFMTDRDWQEILSEKNAKIAEFEQQLAEAKAEVERLRNYLTYILMDCPGLASDLARRALNPAEIKGDDDELR